MLCVYSLPVPPNFSSHDVAGATSGADGSSHIAATLQASLSTVSLLDAAAVCNAAQQVTEQVSKGVHRKAKQGGKAR